MLAGLIFFALIGLSILFLLPPHKKAPEYVDPKIHDIWYQEIWGVGASDVHAAAQIAAVTPTRRKHETRHTSPVRELDRAVV